MPGTTITNIWAFGSGFESAPLFVIVYLTPLRLNVLMRSIPTTKKVTYGDFKP